MNTWVVSPHKVIGSRTLYGASVNIEVSGLYWPKMLKTESMCITQDLKEGQHVDNIIHLASVR